MIGTIAKREFLENIFSFRFAVGLALCLVLIISSAYVLTRDYEQRLSHYNEAVSAHREELRKVKVYSRLKVTVDRAPEPLSIFCLGFDRQIGNTVTVSHGDVPDLMAGSEIMPDVIVTGYGRSNPLLLVFPSLDIAFVIQVVLSLLALLFAYDTISGERERGTAALMLSNSVSRGKVLLGKYIGGMASLSIPFLAGLLSGLVVVSFSPSVDLGASDWIRLGLIFLCSLIYISAFFTLGMLVSSRTSSSPTSLVVLLFLWVGLVILLPNAGPYVAQRLRPVEAREKMDAQKAHYGGEFIRKLREYGRKIGRPLGTNPWNLMTDASLYSGDLPFAYSVLDGSREVILDWYLKGIKFSEPLRIRYADEMLKVYRGYYGDLEKQAEIARGISRLSPAWTYYKAISTLAWTDVERYLHFIDRTWAYRDGLIAYMKGKKAFSSIAFFTRLKESELLPAKAWKERQRELSKEGKQRTWDQVKPLDLSDLPRFEFKGEEIAASVRKSLLDLAILILLNGILFIGAFALFMKARIT